MKQQTNSENYFLKLSTAVGKMAAPGMLLLFILTGLHSCRQADIYEKNMTIPGYKWPADFKVKGSIEIKDINARYNTFVVLRHTDAYRYNNIWLEIGLQAPGESMVYKKVNLSLGNDQTGWEGTGLDDIWEVRKLIIPDSNQVTFKKTGEYHFSISQEMREDPLPFIMSAGLRIEKDTR